MSSNPFLDIQPNVVSKNIESYAFFFAGLPKTGKTKIATRFKRNVIFELEKGAHCIPGCFPIIIKNWDDLESKVEFLNDPATHERFSMVTIDTIDKMLKFAFDKIVSKYNMMVQKKSASSNSGVEYMEDMGDVGLIAGTHGNHWNKAYDLVDKMLTKIFKIYGYGLIIIGHVAEKKIKVNKGKEDIEYTVYDYVINDKCQRIVNELVDVSCLIKNELVKDNKTNQITNTPMCYFRSDGYTNTGNRFKYLNGKIPFTYENLQKSLIDAIEKEEREAGSSLYTDDKQVRAADDTGSTSFCEIKKMIQCQLGTLKTKYNENNNLNFNTFWMPQISNIIAEFGNGKKLNELSDKDIDSIISIRDSIQSLIEEYC